MKILVDTSVWSLALRRKTPPEDPYVHELNEATIFLCRLWSYYARNKSFLRYHYSDVL